MSVHFKFKNHLEHDFITFDALYISVGDLRKAILEKKKIGKGSDYFLEITNAQTKEVYEDDKSLIPKNTAVLVARVPVEGKLKKTRAKPQLPSSAIDDDSRINYDKISRSADLLNAEMSESDKVKAMISQSAFEYDPSKYKKTCKATGLPPLSYRCNRCGQGGHWINNCPTNDLSVKRSTGIPRSFMVLVDGPEHKGALLTSSGVYAVPKVDHQVYQYVKKEKPPFIPQEEPTPKGAPKVPGMLSCMICKEILQDAVTTPCCGDSFCDECIREALIDSDEHDCPVCCKTNVSPNDLVPNVRLRTAVLSFKNKYSFSAVKRETFTQSSLPAKRNSSPQCSPDSTVGIEPQKGSVCLSDQEIKNQTHNQKKEDSNAFNVVGRKLIKIKIPSASAAKASKESSISKLILNKNISSQDTSQPSTPLPDETEYHKSDVSQKPCDANKNICNNSDHSKKNCNDVSNNFEVQAISTIETVNTAQGKYGMKQWPLLPDYSNQSSHLDNKGTTDFDYKHRNHSGRKDSSDRKSHKRHHSSYSRPSRSSRSHSRTGHHYLDSGRSSPPVDYQYKDKPKDRHAHNSPSFSTAYPPTTLHPVVYAPPTVLVPLPKTTATLQPYAPQPFTSGGPLLHTFHVAAQPLPPGVDASSCESLPYLNSSLSTNMENSLRNYYEERNIVNDAEAFGPKRVGHVEKYGNRVSRRSSSHRSSRSETWSLSSSSSLSSLNSLFSSRSRSRSYSYSRSRSSERRTHRSTSRLSQMQKTYSKKQRCRHRKDSRSPSYTLYSKRRSYSRSRSHNRGKSRSMSRSSRGRSRYSQRQNCFSKDRSRSHSKFRSFTRSPFCKRRKFRSASKSNERQRQYYPNKKRSSKSLSRSKSSSFEECEQSRERKIVPSQKKACSKKSHVSKNKTQSKKCKHDSKNAVRHKGKPRKTIALHLSKLGDPCKGSKDEIDPSENMDQQCSPQHEIAANNKNSLHSKHKQHKKDVICREEIRNKLAESKAHHTSKGRNEKESVQSSAKFKISKSRNYKSSHSEKNGSSDLTNKSMEQYHESKNEYQVCIGRKESSSQKHLKETSGIKLRHGESKASLDSSPEKLGSDVSNQNLKCDILDFEPDSEVFSDAKENLEKKCKHQKKLKKHKHQKMKSVIVKRD